MTNVTQEQSMENLRKILGMGDDYTLGHFDHSGIYLGVNPCPDYIKMKGGMIVIEQVIIDKFKEYIKIKMDNGKYPQVAIGSNAKSSFDGSMVIGNDLATTKEHEIIIADNVTII